MEKMGPMELIKLGIGSMLLAKEQVEKFIDEAVKKGEISKEEAKKQLEEFKKEAQKSQKEFEKTIQKEVHKALKDLGLATKEDINALKREIKELKELIEKK